MIYRKLKADEINLISALLDDFFEEIGSDDYFINLTLNNIKKQDTIIYIAQDNNNIVHGMLGYQRQGHLGYGEIFYTRPESRKKSIAGKLLHTAIQHERNKGMEAIRAIVTLDKVDLYIKLGFKPIYHILEREV